MSHEEETHKGDVSSDMVVAEAEIVTPTAHFLSEEALRAQGFSYETGRSDTSYASIMLNNGISLREVTERWTRSGPSGGYKDIDVFRRRYLVFPDDMPEKRIVAAKEQLARRGFVFFDYQEGEKHYLQYTNERVQER